MVSPTCATAQNAALSAGELVLSVLGGPRHGQIVRIRSPKCSIGSDRRCTLRLRARGVLPMHCLIVRGCAGAYVRRWSPDTRLNGGGFDDAMLRPGDRLSVGPVEFTIVHTGGDFSECAAEIVATSAEPAFNRDVPAAMRSAQNEIPARPSSTARLGADAQPGTEHANDTGRDTTLQQNLDEQKRRLHDEWAALNDRRQQFESQCREALDAQEAAEARLLAKRAELERWEARLSQVQKTLSDKSGEIEQQALALATEREELENARDAIEAQRSRFTAESSEIDRRLTLQAADLTRQRIELSRQQEELDSLRQELLAQQARWHEQANVRLPDAERRDAVATDVGTASPFAADTANAVANAELPSGCASEQESESFAGDLAAADSSPANCEAWNDQSDISLSPAGHDDSAIRLEDVLRRLGRHESESSGARSAGGHENGPRHGLDYPGASNADIGSRTHQTESFSPANPPVEDDAQTGDETSLSGVERCNRRPEPDSIWAESDDATLPVADEPADSANQKESLGAKAAPAASGDDDIDAYMAELMRRLGKSPPSAARQQAPEPQPKRQMSKEPVPQDEQTTAADAGDEPEAERRPLSALAPRAIAPEKQVDIGAMRELANQSTRSALDQHAWRSLWQTARSRLSTTATMAIVGLGLLWLHFAWIPSQLALYGGLAALGFGAFLLAQYAYAACKILTHLRSTPEGNAQGACKIETQESETAAPSDDQSPGPSPIDLSRLDAQVAHTRNQGSNAEPSAPADALN